MPRLLCAHWPGDQAHLLRSDVEFQEAPWPVITGLDMGQGESREHTSLGDRLKKKVLHFF